jgi:ferredoxin-type protein NapF
LFINACSRCGDCVPVCPTRIIVIVRGFPEVDFKRGECTFCGACAAACKDGALPRDDAREAVAIKARVANCCLAQRGVECRICGDHCPVAAIRFSPRLGGPPLAEIDAAPARAAAPAWRPARWRRSAWPELASRAGTPARILRCASDKSRMLLDVADERFSTSAGASTCGTWQLVQTWRDASKALVAATKWLSPIFGEFFFT